MTGLLFQHLLASFYDFTVKFCDFCSDIPPPLPTTKAPDDEDDDDDDDDKKVDLEDVWRIVVLCLQK
jgi:hypothetical protein